MQQTSFDFTTPDLPPAGTLELALMPELQVLLADPSRWPGRSLYLETGDEALNAAVSKVIARQWSMEPTPVLIVASDGRIADEPGAFAALSGSERGTSATLVIGAGPPETLQVALPDLESRLRGAAHVALPPADPDILSRLLSHYCDTIMIVAQERDVQHGAVFLPPRLGAAREAVELLNQAVGLSRRARRAAMLEACSGVSRPANDEDGD